MPSDRGGNIGKAGAHSDFFRRVTAQHKQWNSLACVIRTAPGRIAAMIGGDD
jgi:hypothetical protein